MKNNEKIQRVYDKDRSKYFFQKPLNFALALRKYFNSNKRYVSSRHTDVFEYMCALNDLKIVKDRDPKFYLSINDLHKNLGLTVKAIQKSIQDLQDLELIKIYPYVVNKKHIRKKAEGGKRPPSTIRNFYSVNRELLDRLLRMYEISEASLNKSLDKSTDNLFEIELETKNNKELKPKRRRSF